MDEDEEMAELRAQEEKRVRDEAKKCLRHASFQLGKAAYEIDEYLKKIQHCSHSHQAASDPQRSHSASGCQSAAESGNRI